MWDNIIGAHIRRCNRNLFAVNLLALIALIACGYGSRRYLYNVFAGPFPTSVEALPAADPDALQRYFVSINGVTALKTGVRYVEKKKYGGESVKATYFAVKKGDRFLLVKSSEANPKTEYQGSLEPADSKIRGWFNNDLAARRLSYDDVFLPYMLDATGFRAAAYGGLLAGIPLALLALYNLRKAMARMRDFTMSPIYGQLALSGRPEDVAQAIDADFRQSRGACPVSKVDMSQWWMLRKSMFGLDVLPLNDAIWVHQKVTRHYTNGIPTGRTFAAIVSDRHGRQFAFVGREKKVMALMTTLVERLPWIAMGYSAEMENLFRSQLTQFVAAIDQRRATAAQARCA